MRFTKDPRVVSGTSKGPDLERVLMRGAIAEMMLMLPRHEDSKAIAPVHIVERRIPMIRVRVYYASIDGKLWTSPGHMDLSLLQYARLWVRAAFGLWRDPVLPRAWVRKEGR